MKHDLHMQDLAADLQNQPTKALDLLAVVEEHHLPKTAAACERLIAKFYGKMPDARLQSISHSACLRITKAMKYQLNATSDYLAAINKSSYFRDLPSAEAMLKWR